MTRTDSLIHLEQEVGVLVRRIKRVIGVRARLVHEDMQPSSYLMLAYLAEHGPTRSSAMADIFAIDKGAISRQVHDLVTLGLVDRSPDPDDGRAWLLAASDDAVRRLADVGAHRRKWLDEQLGDWSEDELADFAAVLGRYNQALTQLE